MTMANCTSTIISASQRTPPLAVHPGDAIEKIASRCMGPLA
jgi:hypothetical protein